MQDVSENDPLSNASVIMTPMDIIHMGTRDARRLGVYKPPATIQGTGRLAHLRSGAMRGYPCDT